MVKLLAACGTVDRRNPLTGILLMSNWGAVSDLSILRSPEYRYVFNLYPDP
ncbi:MAG: hypothetical protein SFW36_05940 [Leptolyngbyaceae cyanobacterium bins.59]|nr:hypothetical protein [Leptolyngbyaceae cyanobacterium bins.59]